MRYEYSGGVVTYHTGIVAEPSEATLQFTATIIL